MKVIVAMNAFKGSLTSMQAGAAVKKGILRAHPDAEVIVKPLADGGDGTTDALIEGLGAERVDVQVSGPLGDPVDAYYGWLKEKNLAVMEMAEAAGLALIDRPDPMHASTFGVGEMIKDALSRGIRNFMIGIGGSATNDGGIGMLKALGWKFLTASGLDAGEGMQALPEIVSVIPPSAEEQSILDECSFQIACDVTNPLCGPEGASHVYGPQKGIPAEMLDKADRWMKSYADVTARATRRDCSEAEGSGAAGGLGFAFLSYLNADLVPGAELIMDVTGLKEAMVDADIAVTGEGRIDSQTVMGKAPIRLAQAAKQYGCRVLAFSGSVADDAGVCNEAGIDAFFPIVRENTTLGNALQIGTATVNLENTVEQVFRLL